MNLFPTSSGARPRLACEIAPEAVVAARSDEPGSPLAAVARVALPPKAVTPGLKPGNIADRIRVIAAIRRALEQVGGRPNGRRADATLIIPDGAARVLLLDFDALPSKLTEALPVVRFRLKKQLPFDADEAVISYQIMSSGRNLVRVLAVAMPRDVLREYETLVREAGFEPGAILPSTLAALPGLTTDEPALLINTSASAITTAILKGNTLLLHRSIDLVDSLDLPDPAAVTPDSSSAQQPLTQYEPVPHGVVQGGASSEREDEVAQAISVAVAYFEDTLSAPPEQVWNAGARSAEALAQLLERRGLADTEGLRVRELVESSAIAAGASAGTVPRAALAGVMGALRT